jgi:predicted DCC family thiol-disulfide oxidoreductase YuxK
MKHSTPCILFDPDCPLCLRFKQILERLEFDIDLSFYPIDDLGLKESFPQLNLEEVHAEVHLVLDDENQSLLKGPEVIKFLTLHNESVKKHAWLLETNVGQKASELFYQSVNKVRESLHNHCPKCKNKKTNSHFRSPES